MDDNGEQAEQRLSLPETFPERFTMHDPSVLKNRAQESAHFQDIQHLQLSQVALSNQIAELASELQRTKLLAQETDGIVRGPSSLSERSLQRALLYANIAAAKV